MRKFWIFFAVLALVLAGFGVFAIAQKAQDEGRGKVEVAIQDPLAGSVFDQRVSASFQDATLAEVLRWLSDKGVNFVADPSSAGDAKVTLNVTDVPLRDVLKAIALVFNGTWSKSGEVYAFKPKARRPLDSLRLPPPSGGMPFDRDEWRRWFEEFERQMPKLPDAPTREQLEEFLRRFRETLPPEFHSFERLEPGSPRFFRFETPNLSRLFESITDDQWRKHEQQGYLTPEDLTEEQRQMLGGTLPGKFSITLNLNGRTLNLRSR